MKKITRLLILLPLIVIVACNQPKDMANTFFDRGNAQMKSSSVINAIIFYNKAIALDSTKVEFYMARADARLTVVDYEGAMKDYYKVLQLDPNKAGAYLGLGVIKVYMKEFTDETAAQLTKAIQLDPKLMNAYYNLGVVKYVQHDTEAACINWKKAAELGSNLGIAKVKKYCN